MPDRGAAPASYIPVVALPSPAPKMVASVPPQSLIGIEVSGGRKVRVGADIDTGALKRIITALETL